VFMFLYVFFFFFFFFSSRRRHTRSLRDWSSDVCSSDLKTGGAMRYCGGPVCTLAFVLAFLPATSCFAQKKALDDSIRQRETKSRSEERRVGKECRYRRAP